MKKLSLIIISILLISFVSAATLYYSSSCPHCQNVLPYINIIPCIKLCNVNNQTCQSEYNNLKLSGVPSLVLDNQQILTGDTPILDYISSLPFISKVPSNQDKLIGEYKIGNIIYELWQMPSRQKFLGRDIKSS